MLNACLKRPHISLFQGEGIHDLFLKSYVFGHLPLSYCLIHTAESALPVFNCLPDNSPLWKREGTWNQNASHNILFLGSLLGTCSSAIGQFFFLSLVTVPEVFVKKKEMNLLCTVPISFLKRQMVYYQMNDCKCNGNRAKY